MLVVKLDAGWNTTSVVGNGDGISGMNGDDDVVAMTGKRLVNRVIDNLKNHVMQTGTVGGIANIHARTFTNRFKSLQLLDTRFVVNGAIRFNDSVSCST